MVKDAEVHAEEDRKLKEGVEARNEADSLIYALKNQSPTMATRSAKKTRPKSARQSLICARPWKAMIWKISRPRPKR
jgi:molecular chaperone DnaK (HSP70)